MNRRNNIIKVLVYVPFWGANDGIDGVSSYIVNLYKNIDRRTIKFDIISFYSRKAYFEDEIISLGGEVIKFPLEYKKGLLKKISIAKLLVKEINNGKYDAVYIQSSVPYDHLYMYYIKRNTEVPIRIIHSHNSSYSKQSFNFIRKLLGGISKLFENSSTHKLSCSEKAALWLYRKSTVRENKVKLINNGIDINKFKYNSEVRNAVRDELNLSNKTIIGHVGRFTYQKNHMFLLEIFKEYLKLNKESVLLLIGDGELLNNLKIRVKELDIEEKVIFYGGSNEVNKLMQAMDCFLMPSFYEGLPIVGVEAQGCGLPVIVADTITKELKITENIKFISLKEKANVWAKSIDKFVKSTRKDTSKELAVKGFDINSVARDFELYFSNSISK